MSHIKRISITNFRSIQHLEQDFGKEKFIILIGRGNSGKSTILSAIQAVLSPSWNYSFSDLDFYNQDTDKPICIEIDISDLPNALLNEMKFGLYVRNNLDTNPTISDLYLTIRLTVDETLEPCWKVIARNNAGIEDKAISAHDRSLIAVNVISDYTDSQFTYNKQSPLYALTKSELEDDSAIERAKSSLLRFLSVQSDDEIFEPLDKPLEKVKRIAEILGLSIQELRAGLDLKDNPYTSKSISLQSDGLPFRVQGKGNKRLLSIAIQTELTRTGGIVLIDEIEQGLEPDRIVNLIRNLKNIKNGQVFITTHSPDVIVEADYNNLFIVHKGKESLSHVDKQLDQCRRFQPHALLSERVICCEGKTEVGFIRSIDLWLLEKYKTCLSAKGVTSIDCKGGDNMYTNAQLLKDLGYDVCIIADNDTNDELSQKQNEAKDMSIHLILCEKGLCLEKQLFKDLPWESVKEIVHCPQEDFPKKKINIPKDKIEEIDNATPDKQDELRKYLGDSSVIKDKEWFKHIPGGEFLGKITSNSYNHLDPSSKTKSNIDELLKWAGILI